MEMNGRNTVQNHLRSQQMSSWTDDTASCIGAGKSSTFSGAAAATVIYANLRTRLKH